jgi:hypothetical protein
MIDLKLGQLILWREMGLPCTGRVINFDAETVVVINVSRESSETNRGERGEPVECVNRRRVEEAKDYEF